MYYKCKSPKTSQWQWEYNHQRPHKSLGYKSPKQFELMNNNN
ncbi:MAG: transposase [Flavobacteriaceae bacterium]|nr:transposase [Flavobacteriaceae bacterium]